MVDRPHSLPPYLHKQSIIYTFALSRYKSLPRYDVSLLVMSISTINFPFLFFSRNLLTCT